jgi:GNAT superfamily N-acetyltransferase
VRTSPRSPDLGSTNRSARPAGARPPIKLKILPLTADLFPDLVDLFGSTGPCQRCWCMYFRIGAAYRKKNAASNKAAFRQIVNQGPPPGLLAYHGKVSVGWCQLTPRSDLPYLDRLVHLKSPDRQPVWSISCFYIRKGYRKKAITSALIAAALRYAKRSGAPAVEAYPLDADLSPSATSTGYVSTFVRAGFNIVARHTPPRPILRYAFSSSKGA